MPIDHISRQKMPGIDVSNSYYGNTFRFKSVTFECISANNCKMFFESLYRPFSLVYNRITKHLHKSSFDKLVQLGELLLTI